MQSQHTNRIFYRSEENNPKIHMKPEEIENRKRNFRLQEQNKRAGHSGACL